DGGGAAAGAWLSESVADLSWMEYELERLSRALSVDGVLEPLDTGAQPSLAMQRTSQHLSGQIRERLRQQVEPLRLHALAARDELSSFEVKQFLDVSEKELQSSEHQQKQRHAYTGKMVAFPDPAQGETAASALALGLEAEQANAEQIELRTALLRDLSRVWRSLLEGESLRLSLIRQSCRRAESGEPDNNQEVSLVDARIRSLRQRMRQLIVEVEDDVFRVWFPDHLQLVLDHLDERLAEVDDIPLAEATQVLEVTEARASWLLELLLPLQQKSFRPQTRFDRMVQQTRRLWRRIRAENQERHVQFRLEHTFGASFVSKAENLTLSLIFVVLVLLVIEWKVKLTPGLHTALMWVDTAICGWFLAEFFTKMALAHRRLLYFGRHFLIDFLPSLPFGFFFWLWQPTAQIGHLSAARTARLLRAQRLARYIRFLRPIVRIFRLSTFLVRALDRLLRKFEPVFNRNVILFPRPEEVTETQLSNEVGQEIQTLRDRARQRMKMWLEMVSLGERIPFLRKRLESAGRCIKHFGGTHHARRYSMVQSSGEISLERLIQMMTSMDAVRVEESLGASFIRNAYRILRYVKAPGVRRLPVLRKIAQGINELDPAAAVAWMIQRLGRRLERIQGAIHWVGDWYGMVTGPQVLDRVGLAMINATMRPAKRLFLFGFLFILVSLLLEGFHIHALHGLALFLGRFLGASIVVLGLFSMVPLVLGYWFRMLAGESTDLHSKIYEAQFIGRLKQIKRQRRDKDLLSLSKRVLQPEDVLRDRPQRSVALQLKDLWGQMDEIEQMAYARRGASPLLGGGGSAGEMHQSTQWLEREQMLLLYEDYLEGTPLHRSDIKTTNQLLGNLLMQNLRRHRLRLGLFDQLRIDRLDLSKDKWLLYLGPYLWFASITESMAQRIASLIVDFNQHCVPLIELGWCSEAQKKDYETWKARRFALLEGTLFGKEPEREKEKKIRRPFLHNEFTALHFVSVQPERDQAIADIFGEDVMRLMKEERKAIVREIFGFYPFHRLAKEQRTFNLFQLYQRYGASGRIFLSPLAVVWWLFKGIFWGIRSVFHLVRDILRPPTLNTEHNIGWAGFHVAARKLNRMRKPLYMESMRLRSMLDAEYLGLFLPGRTNSGLEGRGLEADLDFIAAFEQERSFFYDMRNEQESRLFAFNELLEQMGWLDEDDLKQALSHMAEPLGVRSREVLRSMTSAYLVDYREIRSLHEAYRTLTVELLNALADEAPSRRKRFGAMLSRGMHHLRVFFARGKDRERQIFQLFLESRQIRESDIPRHAERAWDSYLSLRGKLRKSLILLGKTEVLGDALASIQERLEFVIREHRIWSEELLALRTIQTLTQIDVRLYRELIYSIGEYEQERGRLSVEEDL
ncbi:MAG: ion transporter, partial [Myxococcales bacterium]|nr:ion transporter [Myxococcales bacterium]